MKRSERLVAMTYFLIENPNALFPLPHFVNAYQAAKSSVSEDVDIIDGLFRKQGIGYLETVAGAAGGVRFVPKMSVERSEQMIETLIQQMETPDRILAGGYVYMSDLLGHPKTMKKIGQMFASVFVERDVDYVVTVATKGIPIAFALGEMLNVPVIIIRRDPKVTEGSTVSINYVSGSSRKIQTMVLSKRSIEEKANVVIVDDFMKAGGTINGMISLMDEFNATVKGIGVLAEADDEDEDLKVKDYVSLLRINEISEEAKSLKIEKGNFFKVE